MIDAAQTSFLKPAAPKVAMTDVAALVAILERQTDWTSAADLEWTNFGDRKIRAIANAAIPSIVSFPGSPGYRLFDLCTVDEVAHAIDALEHQGREMMKRALCYRHALHKRAAHHKEAM